jgi:hypothetical protein
MSLARPAYHNGGVVLSVVLAIAGTGSRATVLAQGAADEPSRTTRVRRLPIRAGS